MQAIVLWQSSSAIVSEDVDMAASSLADCLCIGQAMHSIAVHNPPFKSE